MRKFMLKLATVYVASTLFVSFNYTHNKTDSFNISQRARLQQLVFTSKLASFYGLCVTWSKGKSVSCASQSN